MAAINQLLQKGQLIDATFEVQFFISGNDYLQKYRVKNKEGKIYQLKLYNSSKLSPYQFTEDNELLETEILKKINHPNIIKFENSGEIVLDNQKYHYLILNFISGESLKDKIKFDYPLTSPRKFHLKLTLARISRSNNVS